MARSNAQTLLNHLLGETTQLGLSGAVDIPDDDNPSGLTLLNLQIPAPRPKNAPVPAETLIEKAGPEYNASGVTVVDLGGTTAYSNLLRKANVEMFRNYAKYSTWVRAAIDYYRRMLGRAAFELIPVDSTTKPNRRDKQVKAAVELLLRHPNEADESYGTLKEQLIEDYLVIGHGCIELNLLRNLTAESMRILDAGRIGFVKAWDGTDRAVPRYVEFKDKHATLVSRYLAHEQVFCLVNRPQSDTKLGFSHVEALHRSVLALLSGDEYMIKQLLQPIPESLLNLGEGVTKAQVDDFKYQIQSVRDKLAIIGGSKKAEVLRLSATAEEMKILDGQEWFVRQVAAIFGISTAKLKLSVDTSRANTEAMYDDDLEMITGELTRIEELETATYINRWSYLGEINLKFSYPIMHRKDEKQQADIGKIQTGQPWASINEARTRTGEKPLEGSEFPYADEPILNMGKGSIPLPYSVWAQQVAEIEKNIGKTPEPDTPPAEGEEQLPEGDGEATDDNI